MSANSIPNVHPSELLTTPVGDQVEIDIEMAPLIKSLWSLGLSTTSSCQDFGDGTAGQRAAKQRPSNYGGNEFIAYYRGYAWLKMPLRDAQRLTNLLLGTEFRNKITQRWTANSWRIHMPLIYDEARGIVPAETAQIHFPASQIAALVITIEHNRDKWFESPNNSING